MDDKTIIALFFERSEQAIAELEAKYGRLFMQTAVNVLADRSEAEECVNDAYMAVWNAIPPAQPDPLAAYVCSIVRNLAVNRYRASSSIKRQSAYEVCLDELGDVVSGGNGVEEEFDAKLTASYLDEYLQGLNDMSRMLFVRRYWYMDSCEEIALRAGMKPGAVRTRLSRIRRELRSFLKGKGVEV